MQKQLFGAYRNNPPCQTDTTVSHSRKDVAHARALESSRPSTGARRFHVAPPYHRTQNQRRLDNQDDDRDHEHEAPSRKRQRMEAPVSSQGDRGQAFAEQEHEHRSVKELFPDYAKESGRASTSSRNHDLGKGSPNYNYYDPYLKSLSKMDRVKKFVKNVRQDALNRIWDRPLEEQTDGAKSLKKVYNIFMSKKIEREEISEEFLSNTSPSNLKILARNWQAIGVVIFGRMFERKFGAKEWAGDATSWQEIARPGMVFSASIVEQQCDDSLAVDDLGLWASRFSTMQTLTGMQIG